MIQNKLRATRDQIDPEYHPGVQKILINPDGPEAADYIQNMIQHMGHVVKIALENIEDEAARKQIEAHAYAAIKGVQNENGAILGNTRKPLAR
jgi:formiminotetrahydrofolate cyclodeaminase